MGQRPLVIDALFGSGLSRALEGDLAEMVDLLNRSGVDILSIDIPSGLSADTGDVLGPHVQATRTVQLAGAKVASMFYPAKPAFGQVETVDIGIPAAVLDAQSQVTLLTPETVRPQLPTRAEDTQKYAVGTVLVIAGSAQYLGAAEMACRAALRGGAGLVTLAAEGSFSRHLAGADSHVSRVEQKSVRDDRRCGRQPGAGTGHRAGVRQKGRTAVA